MSQGMLKVEGIRCDNPECDYENTELKPQEYQFWVDKPCPKCGTTILTQEDYNMFKLLTATTTIANKLDDEEPALPTNTGKVYKPQSKSTQ